MQNLDRGKIVERRGRPKRTVTIQKELSDELGIIWRDFNDGFYGKGDDLDLGAVRDDLNHAMDYAFDLMDGAPFYPATGDDYMLDRWIKESNTRLKAIRDDKEHLEHVKLQRDLRAREIDKKYRQELAEGRLPHVYDHD